MKNRVYAVLIIMGILFAEVSFINGIQIWLFGKLQIRKETEKEIKVAEEMIYSDIQYFPIGRMYKEKVSFEDDYGAYRENGGHEGCDIMALENEPGVIPIISATNGTITNLGWLYLGGYRIGITSENGNYYYYAHLDSYAKGLVVGKQIKAGEFLGFMGSTGEGEEGTEGNFPVHLHFGVYVKDEKKNEKAVNPYPFLTKIYK